MMQKVVVDKRQELQRLFVTPDPSVSIVQAERVSSVGGSANFVVNGSGGTNSTNHYMAPYHNGTSL